MKTNRASEQGWSEDCTLQCNNFNLMTALDKNRQGYGTQKLCDE